MHKNRAIRLLVFIVIGLIAFFLSNVVDELRVFQGATLSVYIVAISSIILLTGFSGQISLGHGALMAIGGYSAVLAHNHWKVSTFVSFVIAVLVTAFFGSILGWAAARLSGPYLAGSTLALAVGLPSLANQFGVLGGEQGLPFDIGAPPKSLGADFTQYKWYFWIAALAALVMVWFTQNILTSRFGRQWRAMRSAPVSAALSGINLGKSKVLAFTISSGIAGLAGALLVMTLNLVTPSAFPLSLSFAIVTGAVLAGVTNLAGGLVGGVVLVAIPDIADLLAGKLGGAEKISANFPGFITSLLLIVTVLLLPNGPKMGKLVSRKTK
jgi:branched-chain amino acid transport system permease protein